MKHTGLVQADIIKKKNRIAVKLVLCAGVAAVLFFLAAVLFRISASHSKQVPGIKTLYSAWETKEYRAVYDASEKILTVSPWQNTALAFRGYAAFFIALSQTDLTLTQTYLDEAIHCIRVALQNAGKTLTPQLKYMLGKAYFHKNSASAYYYYSDLAVKYLSEARGEGYVAEDIPELLGLCYADLGMTEESIAAFTEALLVHESDVLLLAIARQYYNSSRANTAKQYLYRISAESDDDLLILKSRLLLAQIYTDEGAYQDAVKEYTAVLEKDQNSADAYYGLGVLYEKQGDLARARAEWRRVLKIRPDHSGALKKLGL